MVDRNSLSHNTLLLIRVPFVPDTLSSCRQPRVTPTSVSLLDRLKGAPPDASDWGRLQDIYLPLIRPSRVFSRGYGRKPGSFWDNLIFPVRSLCFLAFLY